MKLLRRPVGALLIMALEIILAILGFFSGMSFLLDPSGSTHGMDTSILVTTPVATFTPVGAFFVCCYGILPIVTVYGLWKLPGWRWIDSVNKWTRQNWSWTATLAIGVILIVWIAVEVALIGSPVGLPRFLQVAMALVGVVLIGLAMLSPVRKYAIPRSS